MSRLPALLTIALTGLALVSCGAAPQHRLVYQYRCCTDDFQQVYAPGQALSLHWMTHKEWGETTPNTRYAVLRAEMKGPYARRATCSPSDDPACLKGQGAGPARRSIAAPTLRADTWKPENPVSRINLSTDVPPGFYLLTFVSIAGMGASGGSAGSLGTGASVVVRVG